MNRADTPFIHCIETPVGQYVFDVNQNRFLSISDQGLYRALQALEDSGEQPALEYAAEIGKLQARGYLSTNRPKEMQHGMTELVHNQLDNNIEQMTLQLTQQCNFRCTYCTYAPKDFHFQREHTPKRMSFELAKKAIDFFLCHSTGQPNPVIGFYGGEPFLEIELMKRLVFYAEKAFEGKELRFTVTTNGSLLTKEVADFLCNHNIDIMVSLDGPPDIHNRSRKFASSGKGTYSVIERNLRFIQQEYPMVFNRIMYNIVIDSRFSCHNTYSFFDTEKIYCNASAQSTLIDDFSTMERVVPSEPYQIESQRQYFLGYLAAINKYPSERVSKLIRRNIDSQRDGLERVLKYSHMKDRMSHGGPCMPGQRRLFVNVDGDLFPCERVNETSPVMRIGTIEGGFDYEAANRLLNIVALTPKQCQNCWAIAHCTTCAKYCDNNGELSPELKLEHCQNILLDVNDKFRQYLLEHELTDGSLLFV